MAKADLEDEVVETPVVQPVRSRTRLLILIAFSAVVLFEMILLVWFLPKPNVSSGDQHATEVPGMTKLPVFDPEEHNEPKPGDLVEKTIPPFLVMVPAPDGTTGYNISAQFTLRVESKQERRYETLYALVKGQIRDQINVILSSSKIADITDPNRMVIRNRILLKVNEILREPHPIVKDVLIESFNATPM